MLKQVVTFDNHDFTDNLILCIYSSPCLSAWMHVHCTHS